MEELDLCCIFCDPVKLTFIKPCNCGIKETYKLVGKWIERKECNLGNRMDYTELKILKGFQYPEAEFALSVYLIQLSHTLRD